MACGGCLLAKAGVAYYPVKRNMDALSALMVRAWLTATVCCRNTFHPPTTRFFTIPTPRRGSFCRVCPRPARAICATCRPPLAAARVASVRRFEVRRHHGCSFRADRARKRRPDDQERQRAAHRAPGANPGSAATQGRGGTHTASARRPHGSGDRRSARGRARDREEVPRPRRPALPQEPRWTGNLRLSR